MNALRFVNARLVCPVGGVSTGELVVNGETIANGPAPADAAVIDCKGKHLAPAIVDLGAFAVDPAACCAGGIVRVGLMPDQSPVLDDPGIVRRAATMGKPELWVHPLAAATQSLGGRDLAEMAINASAGARGVATGRGWIADSGVMRRVLAYARDCDLTVVTHAEDAGLTAGAVATDGLTATLHGLRSASPVAEALAVARDLMLAQDVGARLHIRQVTTAAAIDLVRVAKREGVRVTCGITPAHLLLSDIAVSDFRSYAHVSPPLRSEADRRACIAGVADGTIDVLASGHDPRGPEEKRLPFADSSPGIAGARTLLALALGIARDAELELDRLFAMLATTPAQVLGVHAGTLQPGMPADLLLFDEGAPWRIDADAIGNTPFDGMGVQGRVLRVFKGGREYR